MGREIRRVPANWVHPKDERGRYQPMFDEDYEAAITEWIKNHELWMRREHPDQIKGHGTEYSYYAEWNGNAPEVEYYRPKWTDEERTHYQVYETVSEGTPVTPVFATKEGLIEYLIEKGDFWAQESGEGGCSREAAEAFVKYEWAPSMTFSPGEGVKTAYESLPDIKETQ
jgi:hypothetical protein